MICNVNGLMPVGSFSSAKLNGISSPVSRFFIMTLARISCTQQNRRKGKMTGKVYLIRGECKKFFEHIP